MDKLQKQLLENIFDSLDRLFDRECRVIDLYALLFASDIALGGFNHSISLSEYTNKLEKIMKSRISEDDQMDMALIATDNLRCELNDLLPFE